MSILTTTDLKPVVAVEQMQNMATWLATELVFYQNVRKVSAFPSHLHALVPCGKLEYIFEDRGFDTVQSIYELY